MNGNFYIFVDKSNMLGMYHQNRCDRGRQFQRRVTRRSFFSTKVPTEKISFFPQKTK